MRDDQEYVGELRKRAERRLHASLADPLEVPLESLPQLAHELQVHQIELEMQNEELRRSYGELEEARHRFGDLFDLAPLGYFILDKVGRIVQTNIAGAKLLGVAQAALVGRHIQSFVAEDSRDAIHLHLRSAFRDRSVLNCELEMQRQDSSRFVGQFNGNVHRYTRDVPAECLAVVSDVSERKAAEEMMRKAQEASETANAAKTRFLAAASHDIRQPLQALTSIGELLRLSRRTPEDLELLGFHAEALTTMRELLDSLLEVSRLDAGAITPNVQSFSIAPLLRKLEARHGLLAKKKGLGLRVAPCSALIQSDSARLLQILDNLVANAIRYTETGEVLVGCRRSGSAIRIEVWDTGIGIPKDEKERIFEDFYQLGGRAGDSEKGLGLGLAIVQRTANLLGHPLDVRTRNQGSTFAVTVPLGQVKSDACTEAQTDRSGISCRPEEVTVLLVDDDEIVCKCTEMVLKNLGYRVIAATDGEKALRKICNATRLPDIILTDYHLGGGQTGSQVVEDVRSILATEIPAVILTGDNELAGMSEVKESPWIIFQKPVEPHTLNNVIQGLLSQG